MIFNSQQPGEMPTYKGGDYYTMNASGSSTVFKVWQLYKNLPADIIGEKK